MDDWLFRITCCDFKQHRHQFDDRWLDQNLIGRRNSTFWWFYRHQQRPRRRCCGRSGRWGLVRCVHARRWATGWWLCHVLDCRAMTKRADCGLRMRRRPVHLLSQRNTSCLSRRQEEKIVVKWVALFQWRHPFALLVARQRRLAAVCSIHAAVGFLVGWIWRPWIIHRGRDSRLYSHVCKYSNKLLKSKCYFGAKVFSSSWRIFDGCQKT